MPIFTPKKSKKRSQTPAATPDHATALGTAGTANRRKREITEIPIPVPTAVFIAIPPAAEGYYLQAWSARPVGLACLAAGAKIGEYPGRNRRGRRMSVKQRDRR